MGLLARCQNAHLGRFENFWSSEATSVVRLVEANDIVEDLVDAFEEWPGLTTFDAYLRLLQIALGPDLRQITLGPDLGISGISACALMPHHEYNGGVHLMTLLLSMLLVLLGAGQPAAGTLPAGRALYVQPLGNCASKTQGVDEVVAALRAFYPIDVRVLPCQELPKAAYYPPRKRYRAERLLVYLNQRMPKDGWRVLGLTEVDISTTKDNFPDWGVMGLGELPGTATVISSFRCRRKARNQAHAIERLAKVAVHEIGHTLGLPHCPTQGCLMEDAMGKVTTTDHERDFCPACRALAQRHGFTIAGKPAATWLQAP